MYTGAQPSDVEHLAIFNSHSWSLIPSPYNDINFRASSGNMFFWTESQGEIPAMKRMMINNDNPSNLTIQGVNNGNAVDPAWNTNGYVGMGFNTNGMWDVDAGGTGPWSMLHIEGPNNTPWNGDGWRSWMRTGTFMKESSDHLYIGMKNESSEQNRVDALLSWGDDEYESDDNPADCFRMAFTGNASSGNGNSVGNQNDPFDYNGREVMRMTAQGRMGVGPLFTFSLPPSRRVEILDMIDRDLQSTNEPQLRLTYTPATPGSITTTGIWTDFQTTSLGDLYIRPRNATTNRNVGIHITNPGNTLTIETTAAPTTSVDAGLRFMDLTTASTILTNPFPPNSKAVLSVDAQGDVILVEDKDGNVTSACGTVSYIPRMTSPVDIGCSQIFDDLTTIGIGMGNTVDNSFRLHMRGDFLIQPNTSTNTGDIYMRDNSTPRRVFSMYGQGGNSTLAIGPSAGGLSTSSTATDNVYIGRNSGLLTGDETRNTFVGARSGEDYTASSTDGYNTFIGMLSGGSFVTGNNNTAIGETSGRNFTEGDNNTFVGSEAGNSALTDGDDNIFIGFQTAIGGAGGITYADRNVIIGNEARGYTGAATTMTNSVSIGFANRVDCDNCVTFASQVFTGLTEQQVGIGFTNPAGSIGTGSTGGQEAKLYVSTYNGSNCSAYFNGFIYTNAGVVTTSDAMFKDNVLPITNASSIINQLQPKSYTFKVNDFPSMAFDNDIHYGFIAQDVEAILPSVVKTMKSPATSDSAGNMITNNFDFKAINYEEFIPIIFSAMQEMQQKMDSLEQQLNLCCNAQPLINNNENPVIKSTVALSNKETIVLNQNSPNPFRDRTEITYTLPESVKDAVIMFYDHSGKVIQKFEISHRGAGSLTVYGEDLTSGVYTYSLIIDGENHQTKRMVKQ